MPVGSYDIAANGGDLVPTTKRPDNTAFKQQKLPAWQPILSPKSVLPTFFLVAIIFIPLGAVLVIVSNDVVEASTDYTDCPSSNRPGSKCSEFRTQASLMSENCTCLINITVPAQMQGNIYAYYGLSNFFQNHRRYVKSRDDIQLVGEHVDENSISTDCSPYRIEKINQTNESSVSIPIAPCGAIANSLFNDSFTLSSPTQNYTIVKTGIAWETDHTVKFNNPPPENNLTAAFSTYAKPKFWSRSVIQLDEDNKDNNGYKNEAFEVWMRTAAFPTFRKLYGRLNTTLEAGDYHVWIDYNYPVTAYSGRKRFILSTTSFMGGKNNFLGIAYIVVGTCSFIIGVALSVIHFVTKKSGSRSD